MDIILYGIFGGLLGCGILLVVLNLTSSKPSPDINKLIRQSEERQKISEEYGKELDKLLEN